MGWGLSIEDRMAIVDAMNILKSVIGEPGPGSGDTHSPEAADDEPVVTGKSLDHSSEARSRRLRLIHMIIQGELP
jgi:hypothetical protein